MAKRKLKTTKKIGHEITQFKDYLSPFFLGTLWTTICLVLSYLTWWLIYAATEASTSNTVIASVMATLCFCYGLYVGRDIFKPEMRTAVVHTIK
jgi:hypothetical protein